MKNYYLLFVLLIASFKGFTQDVITTKDGRTLEVKITEENSRKIYYKLYSAFDTSGRFIKRNDVSYVNYEHSRENGRRDNAGFEDMTSRGRGDARRYYSNVSGAWAGTFVTTALTGALGGLVPAIACSSTYPADKRLDYPDTTLMQNEFYRTAYIDEAKKKKSRKVWGAYGYGILTAVVGYLLISAAGSN